LDLAGLHQQRNARTALAALQCLREKGWAISDAHIAAGLAQVCSNTGFAGRWQALPGQPRTFVDIGHNADGLRTVNIMLGQTPHDQLHVVLGTVNDKDLEGMLSVLPRAATYYFCKADIPRGMEAHALQQQAAQYQLAGAAYGSVQAALAAARQAAGANDLVLVTGSAYVVAEVV